MTATPATVFNDIMTTITGNVGGAVDGKVPSYLDDKERVQVGTLTLASQTNGTVIGIARIPIYALFLGISILPSVSLGSSTVAFGDAGSGNSAIYGAAATDTSTSTPLVFAVPATYGVQITTGYDCVSGLAVTPLAPGAGGALYEDIIMTIGAANFPASGTLKTIVRYMIT